MGLCALKLDQFGLVGFKQVFGEFFGLKGSFFALGYDFFGLGGYPSAVEISRRCRFSSIDAANVTGRGFGPASARGSLTSSGFSFPRRNACACSGSWARRPSKFSPSSG
jgi:hypothetical protein